MFGLMVRSGRAWACAGLMGACVAAAPEARGELPLYGRYELVLRANFGSAYRLPPSAFFTNNTADINDSRQIAIKIGVIGGTGTQGIWFGSAAGGQIEYTSPADASLSDASLNNAGRVVFEQNFSSSNGIYFYDSSSDQSALLTRLPFGATGWSSPQINQSGQVGYRASFAGAQAWVSYDGVSATAVHAAEAGLDAASPYSFLFTPSFNNARQIAGKVRRGAAGMTGESQPDEIRLFSADGSSILIARDRDADPASPYSRFDNSVSLTGSGKVAFTATLAAGGRAVLLGDGASVLEIARSSPTGAVRDIEFFAPAANDAGLVAFRAIDSDGLRSVWVGDGTTLLRIIGEHDLAPSDLGLARIDQHDSSPVFGGGVAINARGDVTFNAALTPADNPMVEWGSGIYIARALRRGDLNCSDSVTFDDIDAFVLALAGPAVYAAAHPDCERTLGDFTCDGLVDFADIDGFVRCLSGACECP